MLITYEIFNLENQLVGILYVTKNGTKFDSDNKMFLKTVKDILKRGVYMFLGSTNDGKIISDDGEIKNNVNEYNFEAFDGELIKNGYISYQVSIKGE